MMIQGDAREILETFADGQFHACVTSPPYWRLRRYLPPGHEMAEKEIGLEPTVEEHIAALVAVFREVRRVLRPDGTCWINYGDTYASDGGHFDSGWKRSALKVPRRLPVGFKCKDLMLLPHRVAIALHDDGWYVRGDLIWHKRSPSPESVKDRPIQAHEHIILLSKQEKYFYDWWASREEAVSFSERTQKVLFKSAAEPKRRLRRNVIQFRNSQFDGDHRATFPFGLPDFCLSAAVSEYGACGNCRAQWRRVFETVKQGDWGSAEGRSQGVKRVRKHSEYVASQWKGEWAQGCLCGDGGIVRPAVLDPFAGAGTTALAAKARNAEFVGIELNEQSIYEAQRRILV